MAANLLIVESPSKAKTIEKYLGKDYEVIASMGHLRDLPKKSMGVDIDNNFEPKYQIMSERKNLVKELKQLAQKAKNVYLATDPDREGEAISWHIAYILGIEGDEKCRVTFNEITKSAVTEAMKNPRAIDLSLVDAQQARRILDRIVGYKLSPFLWKKIRKGLSAGRVQSVAVKMICDREKEIEKFVPEEFWTIDAEFKTDKKKKFLSKFYGINSEKAVVSNEEEAKKIENAIKNSKISVADVKKSTKKKYAAPPFTTSTLQQAASAKLNFSSKKTMMVAQTLYEGVDIKNLGPVGLITYMRTDSLRISNEAINQAKDFIIDNLGKEYYPDKPNVYKKKSGNVQDAHEAIRPSDVTLTPDSIKDSLTNDQYKLYKLIWNKFISSQLKPAVYDVLTIEIEAENNGIVYNFRTTARTLKFDGCTKVYIDYDEEKEKKEKVPELSENELLNLENIDTQQNFTAPPVRFTEATLIKAMEEKGIGRPSTYAPTITTILSREYVEKDGKTFKPTNLGLITTELMKGAFSSVVDEKFTANMEKQLDEIEETGKDWKAVLGEFYEDFKKNLEDANENAPKMQETSDVKCDLCGSNMIIKSGRFGKFLACPNYPDCKCTKPMPREELQLPCPKCGGVIIEKVSKNKKVFYGCKNYPSCDFASWDKPLTDKCEICGSYMTEHKFGRTKKVYCSNQDCEKAAPKTEKKTKATAKKSAAKKTAAKKTKTEE